MNNDKEFIKLQGERAELLRLALPVANKLTQQAHFKKQKLSDCVQEFVAYVRELERRDNVAIREVNRILKDNARKFELNWVEVNSGHWRAGPFELKRNATVWVLFKDGHVAYEATAIGDSDCVFMTLEEGRKFAQDWNNKAGIVLNG